jgi:hypothetical protein
MRTDEAIAGPISLEWRPAHQVVNVGSTVNVGLYAVADDGVDEVISVMDVILMWDPAFLDLLGVDNNGPYTWQSSGFPSAAPGGLNPDHSDGDALYTARSQFFPAPSAMATAAGLLVTTMQFTALAETPGTMLFIPEDHPDGAETIVVGGISALDVHSSLGSATIVIIPEPAFAGIGLLMSVVALRRGGSQRCMKNLE